jgi:hypothetical protein
LRLQVDRPCRHCSKSRELIRHEEMPQILLNLMSFTCIHLRF